MTSTLLSLALAIAIWEGAWVFTNLFARHVHRLSGVPDAERPAAETLSQVWAADANAPPGSH